MMIHGVVVIGRNEGARLQRCLQSMQPILSHLVYVDSGSTDGSADMARGMGAAAIDLDPKIPFSAARARNEGFAFLLRKHPHLQYVQFVDGDCEISPGWLDHAARELAHHIDLAIVCGRLRERNRDASDYNRLCDLEWNGPVGEIDACGGIFMVKVKAFNDAGGFNPEIIAGEEPELCLRLRHNEWKIRRLDHDMGTHDAEMYRFRQWWKRNVRAGHAYAEAVHRQGRDVERASRKQTRSIWLWGLLVPLLAFGLAWPTRGWSLLLLLGYAVLYLRIRQSAKQRTRDSDELHLYAHYGVIGKFPQLLGMLRFHWNRLLRRNPRIIEYKSVTPATTAAAGANTTKPTSK